MRSPEAKLIEYITTKTLGHHTMKELLRAKIESQTKPKATTKAKPKVKEDPRNLHGKKPTKGERKSVLWLLHNTAMDYAAKLERINPKVS